MVERLDHPCLSHLGGVNMTIQVFEMFRELFKPKPRGEIRFVSYSEADALLRTGEWKLAIPEEDHNRVFNRVYVERIIATTELKR